MLVPGASGFQPARVQSLYGPTAEKLRETGYVVAFVDYHAAYGLQTGRLAKISKEDIGRAILASAAYLKSLPFVKSTEIGVLGWSRGAWGTLAALASIPDKDPEPFQAAALFYPPCQGVEPWRANVQILMLLGEQDNLTPPAFCVELIRRVANPSAVEIQTYKAARHGFDISDLPEVAPYPSGKAGEQRTIGYNRDAAVRAHDEVQRYFKRIFRAP
jgi:dienelactone hydrolase